MSVREENAIIEYAEKLVESDTKKYMGLKPVILIYRCMDKYLEQQKSEIVNLQVMSHNKDCKKIDHDYVTNLVNIAVELKKRLNEVKEKLLTELNAIHDGGERGEDYRSARPQKNLREMLGPFDNDILYSNFAPMDDGGR